MTKEVTVKKIIEKLDKKGNKVVSYDITTKEIITNIIGPNTVNVTKKQLIEELSALKSDKIKRIKELNNKIAEKQAEIDILTKPDEIIDKTKIQ